MKAYRIELLVLDFENYGREQLEILAMNARGLDPTVISIEGRDIGAWSDDHPLNKRDTAEAEYRRLFAAETKDAEQMRAARHAINRVIADLSVLHEDRDPISAAIIAMVALLVAGDLDAAKDSIDAAIRARKDNT